MYESKRENDGSSRDLVMQSASTYLAAVAIVAMLMLAGMSAGCSFDTVDESETVDDGWTLQDDATSSTDTTAEEDTDERPDVKPPPKPQPVKIRLVNETKRTIRYQRTEACRVNAWVDYLTPKMITSVSSCGNCRCETVEEHGKCVPCAAAGACIGPQIAELKPGASVETTWGGRVWELDQIEGTDCRRPVVPPRGKSFEIRMCWGGKEGPNKKLSDQECETISFRYGQKSSIEHVIEGDDEQEEPVETTFKLTNDSGHDLQVYPARLCTPRQKRWVQLDDFNRDNYFPKVFKPCSKCSCEAVEDGGGCAVCGACIEPRLEPLKSGSSETWRWNGKLYKSDTVGDMACSRAMTPKRKTAFQVRFCWRDPRVNTPGITNCETTRMTYGDRTVEHVIKGEKR